MRPSMPYPNGERAFDLLQDARRSALQPHAAPLPAGKRRRRVLPATFGLAVAMRLVPLLVIVAGVLLLDARAA